MTIQSQNEAQGKEPLPYIFSVVKPQLPRSSGNLSHIHLEIWEGEQEKAKEEKRQKELSAQYLKEQEVYCSKELLGRANALNFMYEPPPGFESNMKLKLFERIQYGTHCVAIVTMFPNKIMLPYIPIK